MARFIEEVWLSDFANGTEFGWASVKGELFHIASEFKIELVNSQTASARQRERRMLTNDQRQHEELRPTIYVGGDVLARGLTLDGLQVSYFVREPRTMDTLMQMGRWFGYRPGFDDLVRIWIPERTRDDYKYSAEVTNELRDLLLEMRAKQLTPRDFGLRVRTNPDSVAIIAANKARNAKEIDIGPIIFENRVASCVNLSTSKERQQLNAEAFRRLAEELTLKRRRDSNSLVWDSVPVGVIQRFLGGFRGHNLDPFWGGDNSPMPQIADALRYAKGGDTWRVAIIEASGDPVILPGGLKVKPVIRNKMGVEGNTIKLANNRLGSPGDMRKTLLREEIDRVEAITSSGTKGFDTLACSVLEHPILMIYPISCPEPDPAENRQAVALDPGAVLLSVAIAFPKLDAVAAQEAAEHAKRYMVNTVWLRNSLGYLDDGDDREGDEGA